MRIQRRWWSVLVAAMLGGLADVTAVAAGGAQFIPLLGYREGALKALGDFDDQWLYRLCDPPQRARWRHPRRDVGLGGV